MGSLIALALPTQPNFGAYTRTTVEKQTSAVQTQIERRGRAFVGISDFKGFTQAAGDTPGSLSLTSPEIPSEVAADEVIVSWNANAPTGTGLKVETRAYCKDHFTKFYTLGLWSRDGGAYPRTSVKDQKDADGDVNTDTLALNTPASTVQVRVTLEGQAPSPPPTLTYLGISLTDTHARLSPLPRNRAAWGHEITVPGRTQLGWPGAAGWCSPTSTDMALAFWSERLHRPELDLPVPDVAHAIYDKVYDGTGNWPFNTAFAGSFPGIRAYVTRLSDLRELEQWALADVPTVVSVSYDLLLGKAQDHDPGHLMVCDGFTSDGDIVLNDPAHHPERGEVCRRVFPRDRFLRAWNKSRLLVYLIYPIGTTVPTDVYGHWDSSLR
jgi:hypothetical protein